MKKLLCACVALAAFTFLGTSSAQAGGFRISIGHGHHGHHGHRSSFYSGHSSRCRSYSRSYCAPRTSWYHDTSHYDYHPGHYVRHRGHYDYVPGHYDYHRTGHWHR